MAKKKESKLSFETDFETQEENRLKIRPEDIVKLREELGKLPDNFNPYGADYIIGKPHFLGDEPPCDQFGSGDYRKWEVINDKDPDITAVHFSLPDPPRDRTLIDGYDFDKDDQYFRRLEVPRKFTLIEQKALNDLANIEKKNRQDTIQGYKFYIRFWELVEQEEKNLVEEIKWLKKVWWWRTYGYWYYNDGEPVFLPPDYFDFLNFYFIDEAVCYPEFRDDVRRKFCFAWYLESCTETFKDLDSTGRAKKNEEGKFDMVDLGRRLFFGDCEPKTRRTGATHEAIHKILKGAMTNLSYFSTIISFEGNNAEVHYKKKLLPAFDSYPMCLKPIWEGNRRPTVLRLDAPPNVYHTRGLKSAIAYSDSGGLFANEGDRLNGVLNDEQGKQIAASADIFERWHVNKYTMSTGMGINILKGAYVKNPSTVEQMESGSVPYYKLCSLSDFYRRVPIKGQTIEGFSRIFLPAYLRLEGYIDRFGKSVIETPTERQIRLSPLAIFAISRKGARETMQAERDALLAENTPESMEAYRSLRRKSPFSWAECWLGSSGNVGYNLEIIDKRLAEINKMKSFDKPPYRSGFFYRTDENDFNSPVFWQDDPQKVKFRMSIWLSNELTNQREAIEVWDGLQQRVIPAWRPINGQKFTLGCDPFRSLSALDAKNMGKTSGRLSNSRQSDGGIAVLWEYDASVDGGKSKKDWDSFRCVCSYRYRTPTQEDYFKDVLKCAQWFGAMIYPEQNVDAFLVYMYKMGFGGYGLFDIDMKTGKQKSLPGRYNSTETNQDMVREIKDYVEFRGHIECHDDLLNEIKAFRGVEDFTKSDLKTAFGMALLGSKSRYRELLGEGRNESIPIDGLF
jgi:hypothetical protein